MGVVRKYYDEVGWNNPDQKKHVMARAIRPQYGHFPFENFKIGTFQEWSKKRGLSPYN